MKTETKNTICYLTSLNHAMDITEEELKHLTIDTKIMEKGRDQVLNIDSILPSEDVIAWDDKENGDWCVRGRL